METLHETHETLHSKTRHIKTGDGHLASHINTFKHNTHEDIAFTPCPRHSAANPY